METFLRSPAPPEEPPYLFGTGNEQQGRQRRNN
jgi:hypothetical protein